MRVIYLICILIFLSQNSLLSKTVDAYPLFSIIYEEKIKFSELEKYVFYGRVCKEKKYKNALDEVSAIYYKVCDTKYPEIKLDLTYFPNDDDSAFPEHLDHSLKINDTICFQITDPVIDFPDWIQVPLGKESFKLKENCNLLNDRKKSALKNKNINQNNLNEVNISLVGQKINYSGVMKSIKVYSWVEILLLGNTSEFPQVMCSFDLERLSKNTRNEIIKKIKKIRNMNFPKLQCEGLVTKHQFVYNETKIWIETKNIQIVSD
jgi:hypothetical protein